MPGGRAQAWEAGAQPIARGVVAGRPCSLRPRGEALRTALRTTRLARVELEDLPLPALVRWLRTATGWAWALDARALAEAGIDADTVRVSARLDDVSVRTLLDVVLEAHGLALRVQDTLVWITTRAAAEGPLLTRRYGLAHLLWVKVDFPGPQVGLRPEGGAAPVTVPEMPVPGDALASPEQVLDLVQRLVAPGRWDEAGWSLRATARDLVVRAPAAVHAQVVRVLRMLEAVK